MGSEFLRRPQHCFLVTLWHLGERFARAPEEGRQAELCLSVFPASFFPLQSLLLASARHISQDPKSCNTISRLKAPAGSLPSWLEDAFQASEGLPSSRGPYSSCLERLLLRESPALLRLTYGWVFSPNPACQCWCMLTPQLRHQFLLEPSSALSAVTSLSLFESLINRPHTSLITLSAMF